MILGDEGVCLPAGVTFEQIFPTVLTEISFGRGDVHAAIALRRAMRTHWPC